MWQLQNYRTRKETKQLNGYFQEAGFVGWVGVAVGAGVGVAASADGFVWAAADGSDDLSSF